MVNSLIKRQLLIKRLWRVFWIGMGESAADELSGLE